MKCLDPVLCYTSDGSRILRNFSFANPTFKVLANEVFNCGKCTFCRKKRSYELAIRCVLHASIYPQNCFLTLTYDETQPGYNNKRNYEHIQKFKKSLRRHCQYHFQKKIEIFNVHEYGKKGKKHWHLVVFNHDFSDKTFNRMSGQHRLYTSKQLEKLWTYGFSTIGDVSEASAMYQTQYMEKDFKNGNQSSDKKSHSKHSGIGKPYFIQHYKQILRLGYIPFGNKKIPIPRYFEKLAYKHYCHYYDTSQFFDQHINGKIIKRKKFSPFKQGEENKEIAELYIHYKKQKEEKIKSLSEEWDIIIQQHIQSGEKPEFIQAAENYIYDLYNKTNNQNF